MRGQPVGINHLTRRTPPLITAGSESLVQSSELLQWKSRECLGGAEHRLPVSFCSAMGRLQASVLACATLPLSWPSLGCTIPSISPPWLLDTGRWLKCSRHVSLPAHSPCSTCYFLTEINSLNHFCQPWRICQIMATSVLSLLYLFKYVLVKK